MARWLLKSQWALWAQSGRRHPANRQVQWGQLGPERQRLTAPWGQRGRSRPVDRLGLVCQRLTVPWGQWGRTGRSRLADRWDLLARLHLAGQLDQPGLVGLLAQRGR